MDKADAEAEAEETATEETATEETAAASASAGDEDYLDELERLADLHDKGIITDEEFEAKKKQLLGL